MRVVLRLAPPQMIVPRYYLYKLIVWRKFEDLLMGIVPGPCYSMYLKKAPQIPFMPQNAFGSRFKKAAFLVPFTKILRLSHKSSKKINTVGININFS